MNMELIWIVPIVFFILALNINAEPELFDIRNYGAAPKVDISKALSTAWKEASASETASKVFIPPGTWSLSQVKLLGPAKAPIELEIQGTLQADPDTNKLPNKQAEWITINYVNYLTISGGGVLDGRGQKAWKKNDCHNLSFNFINNSIIHNVTTKNSNNFHVNCISSNNVTFKNIRISAPKESINTDGLHLARSNSITVVDSVIETGDDCISIGDQSSEFHIENVVCGPGHGISIGSLGKNPGEKDVTGIYIKNCTFKGMTNGVRVKTWPSAPATLKISGLHFKDLIMENVSNPVIIDQEYCPRNLCDKSKPSRIEISKVSIKNIRGTSNTAEVVTLSCSSGKPCKDVKIGDIDLEFVGTTGNITTICNNVKPTTVGKQNPPMCLFPLKAQSP